MDNLTRSHKLMLKTLAEKAVKDSSYNVSYKNDLLYIIGELEKELKDYEGMR